MIPLYNDLRLLGRKNRKRGSRIVFIRMHFPQTVSVTSEPGAVCVQRGEPLIQQNQM